MITRTPSFLSDGEITDGAAGDSRGPRIQKAFALMALAAILICLWLLTYGYRGLVYDAQIYAVQALAKLRPNLATDLLLQNVSQDQFTLFPRFYAGVIELIGLNLAALLLTVLFTVWLLSAAWDVVATLASPSLAWLATFMVVVLGGHYGAFSVFYIAEPFLTARLPAEALIATGLACYIRGWTRVAFVAALIAAIVHPLMALPGTLLLIGMRLPRRATIVGASIGILVVLALAVAARDLPSVGRILPVMDVTWAEIVRERSQFLFLQLWSAKDWALNARLFISLSFAVLIFRAGNARLLAINAILVGATGIAIAAIASLIGPAALLMQGQAWRWVWVTTFVSIILLVPTAYEAWQDDRCGLLCAILLISGWLLPVGAGDVYVSLASLMWILRSQISRSQIKYARVAAEIFLVAAVGWSLMDSWAILSRIPAASSWSALIVACMRAYAGVKICCLLSVGALWYRIKTAPGSLVPGTIFVVSGACATFLLFQPSTIFRLHDRDSDARAFAQWRAHIPLTSTVFVTNGRNSGSFVWFTLQRSNYLSPGQSAGVVFSRVTALEVQRRSDVLLPLTDPNWKILTLLRNRLSDSSLPNAFDASRMLSSSGAPSAEGTPRYRRLTRQALVTVCRDPQLGFVVSPDEVGFDPVPYTQPGIWKNWKLYDCNLVRAQAPIA